MYWIVYNCSIAINLWRHGINYVFWFFRFFLQKSEKRKASRKRKRRLIIQSDDEDEEDDESRDTTTEKVCFWSVQKIKTTFNSFRLILHTPLYLGTCKGQKHFVQHWDQFKIKNIKRGKFTSQFSVQTLHNCTKFLVVA